MKAPSEEILSKSTTISYWRPTPKGPQGDMKALVVMLDLKQYDVNHWTTYGRDSFFKSSQLCKLVLLLLFCRDAGCGLHWAVDRSCARLFDASRNSALRSAVAHTKLLSTF